MSKLTREDILKLARLARLNLSEDEIAEYTQELSEILRYVEMLQEVEVDDLRQTNQITGLTNVMRGDVIKNYGYAPVDLLKNVPATVEGQIKVQRMVG